MPEKNHVLVVDDEEVIRDVCAQILVAEGYEVTTARNGKEALREVSEKNFDVVVTDIMMPDMSGLELLEVIKSTSMDVCTVVITGLGTFDMATQSDRLGAREFVVKPFTPDELSAAVGKALSKHPPAVG
ncbi:response regulator SaeR [bacterium BMS3Abin01]|nr:response regulator SaeR [bacterium BMS3Abin01]HDZ59677.1 response regulator [Actinomycetota bacterium]